MAKIDNLYDKSASHSIVLIFSHFIWLINNQISWGEKYYKNLIKLTYQLNKKNQVKLIKLLSRHFEIF